MKNKLPETKVKSAIGGVGHLFSRLAGFGAIVLICTSAPAQNLFVSGGPSDNGQIFEFTPDGVQSTFASGLSDPIGLAFDSAGNLFVPDDSYTVVNNPAGGGAIFRTIGAGVIYKFTPDGVRSTLASALLGQTVLALDSRGNLFVADSAYNTSGSGVIYKFSPDGVQSTFAVGLNDPGTLVFDNADNLFVADNSGVAGSVIYKFTPDGVRSIFVSGLYSPHSPVLDSAGNLFVADYESVAIYKFTPDGMRSAFASGGFDTLLFDEAGNLFASVYGRGVMPSSGIGTGYIVKFTPGGGQTTFASGLNGPLAIVFDNAGDLFVSDDAVTDSSETKNFPGAIYKFTPDGKRSTFAPLGGSRSLAFQRTQALTPLSAPIVATPSVSPNGGRFPRRVIVTLTNVTPGTTIYYTLDGSDPTTNSIPYQGAVVLRHSVTLKAIAVDSSLNESAIVMARFTIKRH